MYRLGETEGSERGSARTSLSLGGGPESSSQHQFLPRPLGLLPALTPDMKRTMCGRGKEETALSTIPSGPPSAKERSQNSLESVALCHALGGTESGGIPIMVSKCLAAAASSAGRDKKPWEQGDLLPTSLSPTSISVR